MYLDYVPLLSKGDFALHYGGVEIIPLLSDKSGSWVNPVFMGSSLFFQLCFLIFKRVRLLKLSPKTPHSDTYFRVVYNSLLSGFSNTFTILATASGLSFTLVHYKRIETRRREKLGTEKEKDLEKIPFSIYLMAMVFFCLNIAQFLRNYALRKFAMKQVKEVILVNFRKEKQRKSNKVSPNILHIEEQPEDLCKPAATTSEKVKDPKTEVPRNIVIRNKKEIFIENKGSTRIVNSGLLEVPREAEILIKNKREINNEKKGSTQMINSGLPEVPRKAKIVVRNWREINHEEKGSTQMISAGLPEVDV